MKPRPFDYVRADTIDEALDILAEHGDDARILAGGQTLLAMLNLRVVEVAILVDVTRIPELDSITEPRARLDRLCELNVSRQVRNVASDVFVLDDHGQPIIAFGPAQEHDAIAPLPQRLRPWQPLDAEPGGALREQASARIVRRHRQRLLGERDGAEAAQPARAQARRIDHCRALPQA